MRKQGKVLLEDIINEKKERSSSESDPKLDLNKAEDLYLYWITKKSRPNQQTENVEIIFCEYTTCSSQITSVKLPIELQKNRTQI